MFSFKKWFQNENLAGPGGGPESSPENQESLAKNNASHGVGAFPSYHDLPRTKETATKDYLDPRFSKKYMSKNVKYLNNNSKK